MPGTKRRAESQFNPRRKSARTRTAVLKPGYQTESRLVDIEQPYPFDRTGDEETLTLARIDRVVAKYNQTLPFIPESQVRVQHVQEHHESIAQLRHQISELWATTAAKLADLEWKIRCQAHFQQYSTFGFRRWYQRSNILELDLELIERIFDAYPILDAENFSCYLLRTLAEALQNEDDPYCEEQDPDDSSQFTMVEKMHLLCKALSDSPDPNGQRHSLRFNAAMIGSVIPLNVCLGDYYIDQLTSACRDSIEGTIRLAAEHVYLDAAAACREIWSHYRQKPDCPRFSPKECFHKVNIRLLWQLTERSHLEARCNAFLACNARLPVELVEDVFEHLLVAEEVPLPTWSSTKDPMMVDLLRSAALDPYGCAWDRSFFVESPHSAEDLERMRHHCRYSHETPGALSHELQGLLY